MVTLLIKALLHVRSDFVSSFVRIRVLLLLSRIFFSSSFFWSCRFVCLFALIINLLVWQFAHAQML